VSIDYDEPQIDYIKNTWWDAGRERHDLWNPLLDDGDALRLAVKLRLDVMTDCPNSVCIEVPIGKKDNWITENTGDDSFENVLIATRRAIVRAAAEIGRGME
jgi:hypothetical protein